MNRFDIATGRNPESTWSPMEMTPIAKSKMERKWRGLSGLCPKCHKPLKLSVNFSGITKVVCDTGCEI